MEAKLADRSLSLSNKQIKNSKTKAQNHHLLHHGQEVARSSSISRQASNINVQLEKVHGHGGVFLNPTGTASFSLSSSLSLPPNYVYHPNPTTLFPHHNHKNIHQPPLLPLPIFHSLPPHITHNNKEPLSPLPYRKQTKKAKPKSLNPKRVTASKPAQTKADPQPIAGGLVDDKVAKLEQRFSLSPPPSSLPLPKFSLRQPKLSCKVEAAAARDQIIEDGGATDNLCRMLRLR